MSTLLNLLRRRETQISFVTTAGVGQAITPSITLRSGCPHTPQWDFGDGTTATGTSVSRTYDTAGPHTVTLRIPDIDYWLTAVDFGNDRISGDLLQALARCRSLTSITAYTNAALNSTQNIATLASWWPSMAYLHLGSTSSVITGSLADLPAGMGYLYLYNTSSVITGSLADLPAGMVYLHLGSTSSVITGSLADLPAGMTHLYLGNTSSVITGSLADLPAGMTHLYLYSTSSTITGGATAIAATGLRETYLYSCVYTAAQLDGLLERLYTDRALFTYATPILQIGGTNPDPNGVYQDAIPPTTGLEYAYQLVNDPRAEGFNKWSISY